ncbi:MAG: PP2C family protein-serine/threonine phosphatase [Patescibacteria group bacterium]
MAHLSSTTTQGPREYQEDVIAIHEFNLGDTKGILLVVMDGHRGTRTADYCAAKIGQYFAPSSGSRKDIRAGLFGLIKRLATETRDLQSGTTFSAVCIVRNIATLAVLGDSPIVIVDRLGRVVIGPEHNIQTNATERKAAVARGGIYSRGYLWVPGSRHGLQMSRSLGDAYMEEVILRKPEARRVSLGPNSLILVCSDGVLDPDHINSWERISELVEVAKRDCSAEDLLSLVKTKGLEDNTSIILWKP